jgi:hypothetical protein
VSISAVGGQTWNTGGATTLGVSPNAVGDALVLTVSTASAPSGIAVSGGGVTSWTRATSYLDTTDTCYVDIWLGAVTTAGSATVTVSGISNAGSTALWAQQFTESHAGWAWGVGNVSSAPGSSGAPTGSGTGVTYPSLAAAASGDSLYVGNCFSVYGDMSAGSTSGYTYASAGYSSRQAVFDPSLSGTGSPAATQTNTGSYDAVAAVITASAVASPSPFPQRNRAVCGARGARRGSSAGSPGAPREPFPSPFAAPARVAGRPAARRGSGSGVQGGAPYRSRPSLFPQPGKAPAARAPAGKGSSAGSAGAPRAPWPSPFTAPRTGARGAPAARSGASAGSPGSPRAPWPSPFRQPSQAQRGEPAARRGAVAGSPGSPRQPWPSPFPWPARAATGKPAARKGGSAGSGGGPPPPPPAPFAAPRAAAKGSQAARKGAAGGSPGTPRVPFPSPFQQPGRPARARPAARAGAAHGSAPSDPGVYRLWPSASGDSGLDGNGGTRGTEFEVSEPCALTGVWFWSAPSATALPSACAIYDIAAGTILAGTLNSSPSWSGAAGSGWVRCAYGGAVTLVPGTGFKVAAFMTAANFAQTDGYWTTGGAGASGIANGPLSAPNAAGASGGSQGTYALGGALAYPGSGYDDSNWWVDVEVSPVAPTVPAVFGQPGTAQRGRPAARRGTASGNPGTPRTPPPPPSPFPQPGRAAAGRPAARKGTSSGSAGAPLAVTLRLWPGNPVPSGTSAGAQDALTLGTQFTVSVPCALAGIWWYSPPGAAALPQACGIWDIASQALVAEDAAPAWADPDGAPARPGDGWVLCGFAGAGATLAAGLNYVASVWQDQPGVAWWVTVPGYWTPGSGLPGENGIADGALSAPNTGSSANGQGPWDTGGAWEFPGTDPGNGEVFWVDVQLQPQGAAGPGSPFTLPGRAAAGKASARRGTSGGSPGAPRQPFPSPFRQPSQAQRGRPSAHPGAAHGSPVSAVVRPAPFPQPTRPPAGRPAAGKGASAGSPGAKYVFVPVDVAPFPQPNRAVPARPAARKGSGAGSPGTPREPEPSPFAQPGRPSRAIPAQRPGTAHGSNGAPREPFPSPFRQPPPTRGCPAARAGRALGITGGSPREPQPSPFRQPQPVRGCPAAKAGRPHGATGGTPAQAPSPFTAPHQPPRSHPAARTGSAHGSPFAPAQPRPAPFTQPHTGQRGKPAAFRGRSAGSPGAPYVYVPVIPAPFSAPHKGKRGASAARAGAARGGIGAPWVPSNAPVFRVGPARQLWLAPAARQLWSARSARN